jgi:dUTPase
MTHCDTVRYNACSEIDNTSFNQKRQEAKENNSQEFFTNIPLLRATTGSCAYDLLAPCDVVVADGGAITKIDTGIQYYIPNGYFISLREVSHIGSKGVALRCGVCDSDYEGNIKVCLQKNSSNSSNDSTGCQVVIKEGKALCQLIIQKHNVFDNELLTDKTRGDGGFGSTDS